jgi:hypothetical protein
MADYRKVETIASCVSTKRRGWQKLAGCGPWVASRRPHLRFPSSDVDYCPSQTKYPLSRPQGPGGIVWPFEEGDEA